MGSGDKAGIRRDLIERYLVGHKIFSLDVVSILQSFSGAIN
jgi:hypothetical protein